MPLNIKGLKIKSDQRIRNIDLLEGAPVVSVCDKICYLRSKIGLIHLISGNVHSFCVVVNGIKINATHFWNYVAICSFWGAFCYCSHLLQTLPVVHCTLCFHSLLWKLRFTDIMICIVIAWNYSRKLETLWMWLCMDFGLCPVLEKLAHVHFLVYVSPIIFETCKDVNASHTQKLSVRHTLMKHRAQWRKSVFDIGGDDCLAIAEKF